jgi:hypothetical protein
MVSKKSFAMKFAARMAISLGFLITACSKDALEIPYVPQITFVGSISGDYDSLPGNRDWPNTCFLKADTVRMTFFSENFIETSGIRSGNFIRIDMFPCSTCVSGIDTHHLRLHCARYLNTNLSYEITPDDTILTSEKITMQIRTLTREHGGAVELYDIAAIAQPLIGNLELVVKNGRIFGSIQ